MPSGTTELLDPLSAVPLAHLDASVGELIVNLVQLDIAIDRYNSGGRLGLS
jgi:hypothetical protein